MQGVKWLGSLVGLASLGLRITKSGHRSFPSLIIPEAAQKTLAVTLDDAVPIHRVTDRGVKMVVSLFPGKMTSRQSA